MKKYNRLLAGLLVMVLILGIVPLSVLAEDTQTEPSTETTVATTAPSSESTETTAATSELPSGNFETTTETTAPTTNPTAEGSNTGINTANLGDEPVEGDVGFSGEPAPIAVNGNITTILVPLSADNQETTYAVAINNPQGEPSISSEDDQYINVWKAAAGTYDCVYVVGHKLGTAKFQLDGKTYTVRVVPRNESYSTSRDFKVSASGYDAEHTKMYYSVNGGELYEANANEVDINQTFPGGFNIMIFAAPADGYALTKLIANQGIGQYYSLAGELEDGSDSNAWPFTDPNANDLTYSFKKDPVNGSEKHGFSVLLSQGSMTVDEMRDLFKRAKALGCDGVLTYTRNIGSQGLDVSISCEVEKLPTMNMAITQYKKAGESNFSDYSAENPPVLEIGDTLRYTFTITRSGTQSVDYYDIKLDAIDSLNYVWTCKHEDLPAGNGDIVLTWDYTLSDADSEISKYAGGTFTANAKLTYAYESKFSKGLTNITNHATANCSISKLVSYKWCDHLPKEIAKDIPLPGVSQFPFGNSFTLPQPQKTEYVVKENGYIVGTYKFICWGYKDGSGAEPVEDIDNPGVSPEDIYFEAGDFLIMPNQGSVTFFGHWHYFPAPQYSVFYSWTGLPEGLTGSSMPGLPTDAHTYYTGQTFQVDGFFQTGQTYTVGNDTYVFSGWKLKGNVVSGNATMPELAEGEAAVTLTGEWVKESDLVTLTITTKDCANVDENQVFLFRVSGEGLNVTVSVKGNGSTKIFGLQSGKTYTVTELTDWSWRYAPGKAVQDVTMTESGAQVSFGHSRTEKQWLDGNHILNIFKKKDEEGV